MYTLQGAQTILFWSLCYFKEYADLGLKKSVSFFTILFSVSFITWPMWSSFLALTPLLNNPFGYFLSYVARSTLGPGDHSGSFVLSNGNGSSLLTLYFFAISYRLRP